MLHLKCTMASHGMQLIGFYEIDLEICTIENPFEVRCELLLNYNEIFMYNYTELNFNQLLYSGVASLQPLHQHEGTLSTHDKQIYRW